VPRLPLHNVKPGMIVSRDVYTDSGLFLMPKESVLNQLLIKRLTNMDVRSVYVAPTPAALIEVTYLETAHYTRQALAGFEHTHSLNITGMDRALEKNMNNILEYHPVLPHLTDIRLQDMSTFIHSVNVCLISTTIGIRMHLAEHDLYGLGLAAILHDVGLATVAPEILNKKDRLTLEERGVIKDHTRTGKARLSADEDIPATCCLVAGQHHENYDGSGYPTGLSGESIHQFARITTVADTYDSMVSKKTFSTVMHPEKACEVMLGIGGLMLDNEIVGAFMENVIIQKKQEQSIWGRLASELASENSRRNIG
jgi:HD-GYP domain-containing protein (c-di-GMP phosphodiesterase class II)